MNTPVGLELAKLLKEKGFDASFDRYYNEDGDLFTHFDFTEKEDDWTIKAPTIAEVVMWLYEKHGIWIEVLLTENHPYNEFYYRYSKVGKYFLLSHNGDYHKNPIDAYNAAIKLALEDYVS